MTRLLCCLCFMFGHIGEITSEDSDSVESGVVLFVLLLVVLSWLKKVWDVAKSVADKGGLWSTMVSLDDY